MMTFSMKCSRCLCTAEKASGWATASTHPPSPQASRFLTCATPTSEPTFRCRRSSPDEHEPWRTENGYDEDQRRQRDSPGIRRQRHHGSNPDQQVPAVSGDVDTETGLSARSLALQEYAPACRHLREH